jgi:hypothetical protein
VEASLEKTVREVNSGPNLPLCAVCQYVVDSRERKNVMDRVRVYFPEVVHPAWEGELVTIRDQKGW